MTVPFSDPIPAIGSVPPLSAFAQEFLDAARYGELEEVVAAVGTEAGVVHVKDDQGRTALHMSAANGHLDIVRVLIDAGADVNAKNVEGNSVLHYAALNAHIAVIQELISKGAEVGVINLFERTPLDEAIGRNNLAVVDAINAAVVAQNISVSSIDSIN